MVVWGSALIILLLVWRFGFADKQPGSVNASAPPKSASTGSPQGTIAASPAPSVAPGNSGASNAGPTAAAASAYERHCASILNGRYGKMPIAELLRALANTPGGPDIQLILQALALRKQEALPLVKEKLRTGVA